MAIRQRFFDLLTNTIEEITLVLRVVKIVQYWAIARLELALRVRERRILTVGWQRYSLLFFYCSFDLLEIKLSQPVMVLLNCAGEIAVNTSGQISAKFVVLSKLNYFVGKLRNCVDALEVLVIIGKSKRLSVRDIERVRHILNESLHLLQMMKVDGCGVLFSEGARHVGYQRLRLAESAKLLELHFG